MASRKTSFSVDLSAGASIISIEDVFTGRSVFIREPLKEYLKTQDVISIFD